MAIWFAILIVAALAAVAVLLWRRHRSPQLALQSADGLPQGYSPNNVGNDASARPWEQGAEPLRQARAPGVPDDFDVEGFLLGAKEHFVALQAAWDRADVAALRARMTDEMADLIQPRLDAREAQPAGAPTEVVSLEAQLLGIEHDEQGYLASIEFSGLVREEPAAGPSPFREVWNLFKSRSGGGWLIAGVQALQ